MNKTDLSNAVSPAHRIARQSAARHAEEAFQRPLEQRRSGLLAKLLPTQLDKTLAEQEVAEVQVIGETRHRALSMALEAKLQAIEEELNETLLKGKAELRVERELFVQNQFDRLLDELNRRMERFQQDLERRFERLDGIKHPRLREMEELRIERDYQRYESWVDAKVDDFTQAITEGVRR